MRTVVVVAVDDVDAVRVDVIRVVVDIVVDESNK